MNLRKRKTVLRQRCKRSSREYEAGNLRTCAHTCAGLCASAQVSFALSVKLPL
jgi:hypothetical protein